MKKKTFCILIFLALLIGGVSLAILVVPNSDTESDLPDNTSEPENKTPPPHLPPPIQTWFPSFEEVLHLRAMLEYDDEILLRYMDYWERSFTVNGLETREDVENFLMMLDNMYLPVDMSFTIFSYFPELDRNFISIQYGINGRLFCQRFRITLHEETSRDRLETARLEALDITNEVSLLVRDKSADGSALRVGDGILVYRHLADHIETSVFSGEEYFFFEFSLDVRNTHATLHISTAYTEAEVLDILANLEFAQNVFAIPKDWVFDRYAIRMPFDFIWPNSDIFVREDVEWETIFYEADFSDTNWDEIENQFTPIVDLSQFAGQTVLAREEALHLADVIWVTEGEFHSHFSLISVTHDPNNNIWLFVYGDANPHFMDWYWHFVINGNTSEIIATWLQ